MRFFHLQSFSKPVSFLFLPFFFCWTEMEYNVNFLPLIKNWQIPFQRCPEISFLFLPFFFSWTEMEYNANFLSLIKIGESPSRDVQRLSILFRWGLNDRELMFASHLRECVWFSRSPGFGLYLYLFNHTLNAFSITHWKIRKFPRSELVVVFSFTITIILKTGFFCKKLY